MKEVILSAKEITKIFGKRNETAPVLDHVTCDIYKDDFTIIMGPSGAGKSTLLYTLSGMDEVSGGKVVYKGKVISRLNEKQMADIRSHEFGFVFQQTHLVSNLTLLENVAVAGMVGKPHLHVSGKKSGNPPSHMFGGKFGSSRLDDGIWRRAETLLEQMNVGFAGKRLPAEVSGGEAQRAAIARAIIHEPELIFADEPTGALNRQNTLEVLNLLTNLNKEGQSILMVTHDIRAAIRGTRLLYLEDGKILDELELPVFHSSDERTREATVNEWLASFQW
ncbi:ABC transporter ATP-binding protein [Clostridium sp. AM58-1XD]|uniref:ABC transporter ATP-binding protein n=1 Tax=Clostridium sp. AM58-1XD TaxID=2292307 RepID=UPI000E54C89D|nr:ABC transporter ATP-binding protein [Clostridium sp. AM58-1XD]RGY97931.1 ABC transporter ATP-binding protein [Clostridium sp. AM58-1XD]